MLLQLRGPPRAAAPRDAEAQRRAKLAAMTESQKLAALREEIALLKQKIDLEKDPIKKAEMGLELKKREHEAISDEKKLTKQAEDDADKLKKAKEKGALAGMTDAEKAVAIKKEADDLRAKADSETDPHKKNELLLESQNKLNEYDELGRKTGPKASVNSLQQMGGFLGTYSKSPEVAAADAQKQSAERLNEIAPNIAAIRQSIERLQGFSVKSGVEY
jgi:hypothetical protein